MDELKRYLVQLPSSLDFREDRKLKVNVYQALFYAITSQGKYLDELFTGIPESDVARLSNYSWNPKTIPTRPFYNFVNASLYSHPLGQSCGRILGENEPVYRCSDCGYDETCVLCIKCFNKDDHIDHNVSVYVSRGDSGGMCDCGDETAFVRKLNCACQGNEDEQSELPQEFKELIRQTLTVVLDYILDVTNFSINTLPFIHKNINGRGHLRITSKHISDIGSLPSDVYGAEDVNSNLWYLVLWNDENHDYLEAETGIRAATGVLDERAKRIASDINSNGRAILKEASVYTDLLKGQKLAEADGLVATIMTARDYMREMIVLNMFKWLSDVVSFTGNTSFREESKTVLAELLLEPDFQFSKVLSAEFFHSDQLDTKRECFKNGLLYNGELLNLALTKLKPGVSTSSLARSCNEIFRPSIEEKLVNSRIQFLLAFEIRFVSMVRKTFANAILPRFFTDPAIKAEFCAQYIDVFPIIINILALSDREEQLASTAEVSAQLFTCPRTNKWIVSSGKLGNILGPLSTLIENHSSRVNAIGYPNLVDIVVDVRSKREKSSIQKTISDTIDSFNRIISKNDEENILNVFLMHDNLVLLLNFQKYFQGSMAVVRKYGDHVERDLLDEFYTFLQRIVSVLNIVKHVTRVKELDVGHAVNAVGLILEFLNMRKMTFRFPGIADFRVSKDPVSYLNPLNSFLSYILQECGIDAVKDTLKNSLFPFMYVSELSLQSIVLAAQVKIGFWIRNGIITSRQSAYYYDSAITDVAYYRDFFLNQVACVVDDPRTTILNFVDRWELLEWYSGEVDDEKTIYEDRFGFICEQFILFLYNMLTYRYFFDNDKSEQRAAYQIKKAICYALCDEPMSYSTLKLEVGSSTLDVQEFDDILYECADYSPPTGLYDLGMYRLKPHIYETLDPLSIHLDSSKYQSISEALITSIAKNKKVDEKSVVLKPDIYFCKSSYVNENIGQITRTKEFAKLIYKLLQAALSSQGEVFLPQLLHLIHAVVLDDERVNGDGHLVDHFVVIPISDLLLSIAESTMASHIVLKADFLLDQFVKRDARIMESLVDCFGEDHVQSYKKRKVGLFETESERRKRLADERKAKVMRKFAKQREKFMQRNEIESFAENETTNDSDICLRKCVSCGEVESHEELFGFLLCKTRSSVFWKVPPRDTPYSKFAFGDLDSQPKPAKGKAYPIGYPYKKMRKESNLSSTVASSCAHGMHYKCYLRAQTLFNSLPCPLCHNLHDSFIPSFIVDSQSSIIDQSLSADPQLTNYEQVVSSYGERKLRELAKVMIGEKYSGNSDLEEQFVHLAFKSLQQKQTMSDKIYDLTLLIADTIRANEIAGRLDGTESLSNFLLEISSPSKALLRSMIQSRLYLQLCGSSILGGNLKTVMTELMKTVWEPSTPLDGAFNEVVFLYFQTEESLRTCMRLGFAKLISTTIASLCVYHSAGEIYPNRSLGAQETADLGSFILSFSQRFGYNQTITSSFIASLYYAIERASLPFLRQCVILFDLLTCDTVGQNEFKSLESVANLKSAIENQSRRDSSVELCKVLNLPTLSDFIHAMGLSDSAFKLEREVVDHHFKTKIRSQIDVGIMAIQYPGVIRLIDLPDDYNVCITDPQYKVASGVDSICLQCGTYLDAIDHVHHAENCSFMPIFFSPGSNNLTVLIALGRNPLEIKIPAPYLTVHGEVKKDGMMGKATLNRFRYQYLQKLWLSLSLFGYVTRSIL